MYLSVSIMYYEILVGGYGGQGILLAGYIIGYSAVKSGLNSTYVPSYGPEARGGRSASRIVISDGDIDYPLISNADYLIIMYQEAYDAYIHLLKPGGILIVDADLVKLDDRAKKAKIFKIPATKIAEKLGNRIAANMVMIGAFTAITKMVDTDTMKETIKEAVRGRFLELNFSAFDEGYKYAEKIIEGNQK